MYCTDSMYCNVLTPASVRYIYDHNDDYGQTDFIMLGSRVTAQ